MSCSSKSLPIGPRLRTIVLPLLVKCRLMTRASVVPVEGVSEPRLAARLCWVSNFLVGSPTKVFNALARSAGSGDLFVDIGYTCLAMSIPMIVSFISDSPWRTVDEHSHFRTRGRTRAEVLRTFVSEALLDQLGTLPGVRLHRVSSGIVSAYFAGTEAALHALLAGTACSAFYVRVNESRTYRLQ